jgi:TRAP transporter 4TM/12TM fusion protein
VAEALAVERCRTGRLAKLILALGALFTFYEMFLVMGLNFALYTVLKDLGLDLRFLLYIPDIHQSMAFLLGLVLLAAFLIYPASRRGYSERVPIYDYILAVVAFLSMFYLVVVFPRVVELGYVEATLSNIVIPIVAIALLLEASRRALGAALPVIAAVILLLGLAAKDFNLRHFVNHMYFAREGLFAIPLYVMVSYVFAFVFFGSVLEKLGVGEYITKFVLSLVGHRWGGPAKTAVVASALVGTVSGSSVANVLTTGTFTIPLMKKAGYPPEVAGAVEPAASTGGQIMPPVMGAAAFVMAQFLGRPYRDIIVAAAIPAILYFASVYAFVDRLTKKLNVRPLDRRELPSFPSLARNLYLLSPIPVVTYLLLSGLEPQYSALGAVGTGIAAAVVYQRGLPLPTKVFILAAIVALGAVGYALGLPVGVAVYFSGCTAVVIVLALGYVLRGGRALVQALLSAFDSSIRSTATVFLAASCAGLIQGTLTLTGWATEVGYRLVDLSGGNIYLLMITAMSISLVLGMGVPTTANYIITSTIVGTPMARAISQVTGIDLESAKLVAHMFVFYFGIMADLTPPVALASYAGSMLARSDFWRTAINATKIGLAGYLVPYIFATDPTLLILTVGSWDLGTVYKLVYGIAAAALTMLTLSSGIVGWLAKPIDVVQRSVLVASSIALLLPLPLKEVLTVAVALVYVVLYLRNRVAGGSEEKKF